MIRDLITFVSSPFFSSVCSLCAIVFAFGYLTLSVMPYSGFMSIKLVGEGVNEDNAGFYAGFINSSYMVGMTISSYHCGKLADVYGRKTVLFLCMTWSSLFSVLFGLSSSYTMALLTRLLLGIGGGLFGIIRTLPTEISNGDEEREMRSIILVLASYGFSMLFAPGAAGFLSDPVSQFPSLWVTGVGANEDDEDVILIRQRPLLHKFLSTYPFFLPNALGSILCLASLLLCMGCLEETLPNRRHPKHMIGDLLRVFRPAIGKSNVTDGTIESGFGKDGEQQEEPKVVGKSLGYDALRTSDRNKESSNLGSTVVTQEARLEIERDKIESAIRASIGGFPVAGFGGGALASSTKYRQRLSTSVAKRASILYTEKAQQQKQRKSPKKLLKIREEELTSSESDLLLLLDEDSESGENSTTLLPKEASFTFLWGSKTTRQHLLVLWFGLFAVHAAEESIPLFLMSNRGGLGLSAVAIGSILSISGGLFNRLEPFVYARVVEANGLHGSMKMGIMLMWPIVASIPLVLWFNKIGTPILDSSGNNKSEDLTNSADWKYGDLTWLALIFLVAVSTWSRVLGSTFVASSTLIMNHIVIPQHRATLNGLCAQGTGVARTLAPSFAGMLVAFCLSSELFPGLWGPVVMFSILATLSFLGMLATNSLNNSSI